MSQPMQNQMLHHPNQQQMMQLHQNQQIQMMQPNQQMDQMQGMHGNQQMMQHMRFQEPQMQQQMQNNMNFGQSMMPANNQQMAQMPSMPPPGTILLSTLIDFVIHKTYHDITVMADLLPSKSDMDRKITIVQFSTRTRQLFVRLLSLVKWANSVGKVVKCSDISSVLDRQASLFVDTADKLHTLSSQLVVQARLPNFSVPAAVDVLTTGSYPRLPLCIRDRIIPPDPILPKEKKATLKRLEQIILYRLVTEIIPPQIAQLKVEKGVVHLLIPGEFKAAVTLMGDGPDIPWRLLKLEFLVEDSEVGSGRSLVHSLQVNYIHELVQSRLFANEKPLVDLYNLLHSFCLSLQLEVLQAQGERLLRLRWGRFIQVDSYQPGEKITLSYWRLSPYKTLASPPSITIQQSTDDSTKPLQVSHNPSLPFDKVQLVEGALHIKHLSLELLIHRSICIRSYNVLAELKQLVKKHTRHDTSHFSKQEEDAGESSVLLIPLLESSSDALRLYIDPQTGAIIPSLDGIEKAVLDKMEKEINEKRESILTWITELRFLKATQQCKEATQHRNILCLQHLHLTNEDTHDIGKLPKERLYFKFIRYPEYYLIITLTSDIDQPRKITFTYYLLKTSAKQKNSVFKKPVEAKSNEIQAVNFMELIPDYCKGNFQREVALKRSKTSSASNLQHSELLNMISICDARISFVFLLEQLNKEKISHQGIQEEGRDVGLVCKLLKAPDVDAVGPEVNVLLKDALLQCSFRLMEKPAKMWTAELIMKPPQLKTVRPTQTNVRISYTYDISNHFNSNPDNNNVVKLFLDDWSAIARLYGPVMLYTNQIEHPSCELKETTPVLSYNYKSITIKYGKSNLLFVTVKWGQDKKFQLQFGRCENSSSSNGHVLIKHYLTEMFNLEPDLSKLMHVLTDTTTVVRALSRLSTTSVSGLYQDKAIGAQVFNVVAQTQTHFRIVYMGVYCVDIFCRGDKTIAIRDASFSSFDFAKVKASLIPIPGLSSFLTKFKDQRDVRHRSELEKDNPPSPVKTNTATPGDFGLQDIPRTPWAGSNFVVLPQTTLFKLCSPPANPQHRSNSQAHVPCLLEQFFGVAFVRRQLLKCLTADSVKLVPAQTPDAESNLEMGFILRSLHFVFRQHARTIQNQPVIMPLLKIQSAQLPGQAMENWGQEELKILEKYFELKVAVSPYRFNVIKSYVSMISAPTQILRDFIQLMRIELTNGSGIQAKWRMVLCLTTPPRSCISPFGMSSILVRDRVLLFVQFTQIQLPQAQPAGVPQTIVIPLIHEVNKNTVTIFPQALSGNSQTTQHLQHIAMQLKRLEHLGSSGFTSAVKFLMENLVLP